MTSSAARPRIFIAEPDAFEPEAEARLARHAEVVSERAGPERLAEAFGEFDAVWIRLGFRVDEQMIGASPRCRVLACPATGLDHIDLEACAARGIRVVSLKGEVDFLRQVRATAEHTVALALALMRRLPHAAHSVLDGTWDRDLFRGHELHEKTIGLVGLGRLGTVVAQMLSGFDVTVLGYDVRTDFPDELASRVSTLGELMERADLVSLHVSYDESTRHLVGAAELGRMRSSAFLINTSRGGILDEAALLQALERGQIAGAALDVLEGEPHLDLESHPLVQYARTHDNLIIVPHIGGNTWESTRKTELFIADKVLEVLR